MAIMSLNVRRLPRGFRALRLTTSCTAGHYNTLESWKMHAPQAKRHGGLQNSEHMAILREMA